MNTDYRINFEYSLRPQAMSSTLFWKLDSLVRDTWVIVNGKGNDTLLRLTPEGQEYARALRLVRELHGGDYVRDTKRSSR